MDLFKMNIEYCTACGTCYATGECPLIDDFKERFAHDYDWYVQKGLIK